MIFYIIMCLVDIILIVIGINGDNLPAVIFGLIGLVCWLIAIILEAQKK